MTIISFSDESRSNTMYWHTYSPNGRYLLYVAINYYGENHKHDVFLVDFLDSTHRKISAICTQGEVFFYWLSNSHFVVVNTFSKENSRNRVHYEISEDGSVRLGENINTSLQTEAEIKNLGDVGRTVGSCGTEYLEIEKNEYVLESIDYKAADGYFLRIRAKNSQYINSLPKKNIFICSELFTSYTGARLYDWVVLGDGSKIIFPMIENETNCLFFLSIDLTPFFTGREIINIVKEDVEILKIPESSGHSWIAGFYEDAEYIIFCTKCKEQVYVNVILKNPFIFNISFVNYMVLFTEEQQTSNLQNVAIHPNGKFLGLFTDRQESTINVQEIQIKNKSGLQSLRSMAASAAVYNIFKKVDAPIIDFSDNINLQCLN